VSVGEIQNREIRMSRIFSGISIAVAAYLLGTAHAWAFICTIEFLGQCDPVPVPEPSSMALLLASLGGLAVATYRKKR
jgi:hypothetical protein